MVTRYLKSLARGVIYLVALCCLSNYFSAQEPNDKSIFDKDLRDKDVASVTQRLTAFSRQIRKRRWENVYDMLLADPVEGRNKKEFLKQMRDDIQTNEGDYIFLGFRFKNYLVLNPEHEKERIHISGCIKVSTSKKLYSYWGTVEAGRNGSSKWMFLSLPIVNPDASGSGPRICK